MVHICSLLLDIHTGGMIDHPGVIEAHQEEEPLLGT